VKWFGSGSEGLLKFDGKTYTSFTSADGLGNDFVTDNKSNGKGTKFVTTRDGLVQYNGNKWTTYISKADYGFDRTVKTGPDGAVWCNYYGITRFDGETRRTFSSPFIDNTVFDFDIDLDGSLWIMGTRTLKHFRYTDSLPYGVDEARPVSLMLQQNHPNPFNPSTTIPFTIPGPGLVDLSVYSITGQKVATLVSGYRSAGAHSVVWNGRDDSGRAVSSGVYLSRLESGGKVMVVRMTVVK
jgi:hypothetical protein